MNQRKPSLTPTQNLLVALLFLVPGLVVLGKIPEWPPGELLWRWLSFAHLPARMAHRVEYLLCVPVGAVLVVFFRLTLGIRLLGPFRPILIAFAFQMTGIFPGLAFLAAIIGASVALRPGVKMLRLPYFGRISIMLSVICGLLVLALLACDGLGFTSLKGVAYFPIVVICLMGEGFVGTVNREGYGSALWRGGMTALVAVLITLVASISHVTGLFLRYPELLLVDVGLIIVIGRYADLRLLKAINPKVHKPKSGVRAPSAVRAKQVKSARTPVT